MAFPGSKFAVPLLFLLAIVVFFIQLGAFGFWEPQELEVALQAAEETLSKSERSSFEEQLIEKSVTAFGTSEFNSRLPLAVLGFLGFVGIFCFARELWGKRTACLTGLAFLASPWVVFHSRGLVSAIGGTVGTIWLLWGIWKLIHSLEEQRRTSMGFSIPIIIGGAWLTSQTAGLLLGIVPVLIAGAFLAFGTARNNSARIVGAILSILAATLSFYVLGQIYDVFEPMPGTRQFLGHTFLPKGEFIADIHGTWSTNDKMSIFFHNQFERIAFGLLPIFPIALLGLWKSFQSRYGFVGIWVLVTWLVAAILERKVGATLMPAIGGLILCFGFFVQTPVSNNRFYGLTACFILACGLVVARDASMFPDRFAMLHYTVLEKDFPKDIKALRILLMALGSLCAVLFAVSYYRPIWKKWAVPASTLGLLVCSLFFSQVWLPGLSEKLSSKDTFSGFLNRRKPGDKLVILGKENKSANFYAKTDFQILKNRRELIATLSSAQRVFALTPHKELCAIERDRKDLPFYVLENKNNNFLLASNQLGPKDVDRNPLTQTVVDTLPKPPKHPLNIVFNNGLSLVGADYPKSANIGDTFAVTLYYKVKHSVPGTWKVLVHLDGPSRINKDHEPITGTCPTSSWPSNKYIIDHFEISTSRLQGSGQYHFWTGFFQGGNGSFRNMPVDKKMTQGVQVDENDRIKIGTIELR